jgi:hypothetical protein
MNRGDAVVSKVAICDVPPGTKGRVLATRKLKTDSEPKALVKFERHGWPVSTDQSNLEAV